jgi:uncharacterized protein with HEPN domain
MPKRDLIVRLEDIRSHITMVMNMKSEIAEEPEFLKNTAYKLAFERAFEIIGEALYQIRNESGSFGIPDIDKIISFRHLLAHDYFRVRHALLWEYSESKLPQLLLEIEKKIDEENVRIFGTNNPSLET